MSKSKYSGAAIITTGKAPGSAGRYLQVLDQKYIRNVPISFRLGASLLRKRIMTQTAQILPLYNTSYLCIQDSYLSAYNSICIACPRDAG